MLTVVLLWERRGVSLCGYFIGLSWVPSVMQPLSTGLKVILGLGFRV